METQKLNGCEQYRFVVSEEDGKKKKHLQRLYLYKQDRRSPRKHRVFRLYKSVHARDINELGGNHGSRLRVVYEVARAKN